MAIASTGFMAAPGFFSSTLAAKLDKIDCSQVLAAVLKADRQLLGHIKMGPVAHNIEFNWIEDELNAVTFEARALVSTSISVDGFAATASLEAVVRAGALLAVTNAAESAVNDYVLLVATVTDQSTIETSSYGNTTMTTVSTTSTWTVIGQPYGDSSDASSDISKIRTKKRNFTQIFERAVEIAQSRKGMDAEAVVNELQLQIKYRTMEMKRELDMALILGMAYYSGGFSGDIDQRTTMGIINYLRDPDLDGTREDTMVTDNNGAALTVAILNTAMYNIWNAGGLDEMADPIIAVGAGQQRIIAAWEKDIRRVEQGERQVGYYRDVFLSDMGVEVPVVLDRWIPNDRLLIIDRARIAIRPLAGDQWHMEKMAKTGRSEKWQLSGQYGLEFRNPDKCHYLITDLSS